MSQAAAEFNLVCTVLILQTRRMQELLGHVVKFPGGDAGWSKVLAWSCKVKSKLQ